MTLIQSATPGGFFLLCLVLAMIFAVAYVCFYKSVRQLPEVVGCINLMMGIISLGFLMYALGEIFLRNNK